jgi:hypothetical protein
VLIPLFKWQQCPIDLKIEIAYCIGNVFIVADFEMIKFFVELGFLDLLVQSISSSNIMLIRVGMTAIRKLFRKIKKHEKIATKLGISHCSVIFTEFERLGGIDALEGLLYHKNHDIYE